MVACVVQAGGRGGNRSFCIAIFSGQCQEKAPEHGRKVMKVGCVIRDNPQAHASNEPPAVSARSHACSPVIKVFNCSQHVSGFLVPGRLNTSKYAVQGRRSCRLCELHDN